MQAIVAIQRSKREKAGEQLVIVLEEVKKMNDQLSYKQLPKPPGVPRAIFLTIVMFL